MHNAREDQPWPGRDADSPVGRTMQHGLRVSEHIIHDPLDGERARRSVRRSRLVQRYHTADGEEAA